MMIYDSCVFMCCMTQVETGKYNKSSCYYIASTSQMLMIHDSCFHISCMRFYPLLGRGKLLYFGFKILNVSCVFPTMRTSQPEDINTETVLI